MPRRPDFDLYEALELSSTASATEITSSYRRLAREHHPDKNPGNEEATEKMQRINAAHEILSDVRLRAQYDSGPSSPESRFSSYYDNSDDEDGYGYAYGYATPEDFMNNFFDAQYSSQHHHHHHFHAEHDPRTDPFFTYFRRREEQAAAAFEAHMAHMEKLAEQEKARQQLRAEQQAKQEKQQAEKAAREEKKKAEEAAKQDAKEKTANDEKEQQELIWKEKNATTDAEKRATCLHGSFWPKHQGKAKYKCMGCNQKRGPTGFKCPHCELLQCQKCLTAFNAKRPTS